VTFAIDHVVLAVADLEQAGERLRLEHGLASLPGGEHPRWGTANRIVPLGAAYLELIAVTDPDAGRSTSLGRSLSSLTAHGGDRWFAVCLADTDLDATAERLGLRVEPGGRRRPDGVEVTWRSAGLEDRQREPWLPFFIAWDVPELHPGRAEVRHAAAVTGGVTVELGGDAVRLRGWLGPQGDALPLEVVSPEPGVCAVTLSVADGPALRL
jgi:hypothetical protein